MIERARALLQDLLPWLAFAGLTGAALWGEVGPELRELLLKWGPGLLIFLAVIQYAPAFVRAVQKQADAMTAVAADLRDLPRRDEMKFEDLRIGQELILRELADLKKRITP